MSSASADGDGEGARWRKESAAVLVGLVLGQVVPLEVEVLLGLLLGEDVVAALHEGFLNGGDFTAVVPLLVGPGGRPDLAAAARGLLTTACDTGEVLTTELLLEADGVGPEDAEAESTHVNEEDGECGFSLLAAAVDRGDVGIVRALVGSGKADVGRSGPNLIKPLPHAAWLGRTGCITALLAAPGMDANATYEQGSSALILAASRGSTGCLRALLAVDGILVNHANSYGVSALMEAAEHGDAECVLALLAADGVDANQTDETGETALLRAVGCGNAECALALLAVDGIDVNHVNDDGIAALDMAACNLEEFATGHAECLRALLAAPGVELGRHNPDEGMNPLHYACNANNAAMASAILVAGGCRFALDVYTGPEDGSDTSGDRLAALGFADAGKGGDAVRAVFLSGVDYWQRVRHGGHSWAMRQVVHTLMLVRQRLAAAAPPPPREAAPPGVPPRMPEEMWFKLCGFLRSADFAPRR